MRGMVRGGIIVRFVGLRIVGMIVLVRFLQAFGWEGGYLFGVTQGSRWVFTGSELGGGMLVYLGQWKERCIEVIPSVLGDVEIDLDMPLEYQSGCLALAVEEACVDCDLGNVCDESCEFYEWSLKAAIIGGK